MSNGGDNKNHVADRMSISYGIIQYRSFKVNKNGGKSKKKQDSVCCISY